MSRRKIETDEAYADPDTYRKMLEPHGSRAAALTALRGFFEDVLAARIKHRLPEVAVVAEYVYAEDGKEFWNAGAINFGNPLKGEYLYALGLGKSRADRAKLIDGAMAGQAVLP